MTKTETAHTPGPWVRTGKPLSFPIEFSTQIYAPNARDGNGGLVAVCRDDCAEWQANGDLITAAPELLELARLVHGSLGGGRVITFSDEDIQQFAAAIAKATGGRS